MSLRIHTFIQRFNAWGIVSREIRNSLKLLNYWSKIATFRSLYKNWLIASTVWNYNTVLNRRCSFFNDFFWLWLWLPNYFAWWKTLITTVIYQWDEKILILRWVSCMFCFILNRKLKENIVLRFDGISSMCFLGIQIRLLNTLNFLRSLIVVS